MKFGAQGNAFNKDFTYFLVWNTANGGTNAGNLFLEQAFATYKFADDWGVRAGQYTDPAVHEQNVSSKKQLTVERSLMNQILTGAGEVYTQGVTLQYQPKNSPLTAEFGVNDGANTSNTDFRDLPSNTTDFGLDGRVEYVLMGDKADYGQFTARHVKKDLLVAGAGVLFTQGGSTDSTIHTADIQYDGANGLSAYGAFLGNYVSTSGTDSYNYGILGQVGYVIPDNDQWEVFGRYDWTHLDHAAVIGTSSEKNFHEITVGVNYYIYGHNAKITVDGSWLPNGTTGPTSLDQVPTTDDEFTLRAQFQLLL